LLGRIEQNKYMTDKDAEQESRKHEEGQKRKWREQVDYQMFPDDLLSSGQDLSHSHRE